MSTSRDAAAAASAGASADRAEQAAVVATDAADAAMQAAVQAAVAATLSEALVPIHKALADLAAQNQKEEDAEAADDETVSNLQRTIITLQSQSLWMSAAMLLVGAAIGYVLTSVVFG